MSEVFKYGVVSSPYFPRIWTEYGDLRSKPVGIRENTEQEKLLRIWTLFKQCICFL